MFFNSHNGFCVCMYVCTCCLEKFSNKNWGTDFSFSSIPNVFFFFFFSGARSILSGWQECSTLKRYKGVDGKDNSPMSSWHNIKKKKRKWEEEIAIVIPLTLPSNYARVKARVTKKMILVVNHLPYFVYIKKSPCSYHIPISQFPTYFKNISRGQINKNMNKMTRSQGTLCL